MRFLLQFLFLLPLTMAQGQELGQEIEIITFNTAFARAFGHDFNPCVLGRVERFIDHELKPSLRPQILLLQEVFYGKAQEQLQHWAQQNGYQISKIYSPLTGLVTLTNLQIIEERSEAFSCHNSFFTNFGTLTTTVKLGGKKISVMNTHTYFSDGTQPSKCHIENLNEIISRLNQIPYPKALGGDLNIGPNVTFYKESYSQVEKIWNPFLTQISPNYSRASKDFMTWDLNNPLTRPFLNREESNERMESHQSSTLDHIFISKELSALSSRLVFEKPVPISQCQDYEVEPGKSFLSDHFGISALVKLNSN